ncbi:MAG: aminotransferase class V-fold PLP-dependent enzyme [Ignavibacteria bacterium]|nr:aminotransferase class V-fold PLP-dependent enzyme [Ignavibacteria bacterium]
MPSRRQLLQSALAFAPAMLVNTSVLSKTTAWIESANGRGLYGSGAADEDFWRFIQQSYDIDRAITNLNNGGVAPSPRTVMNAVHQLQQQTNNLPAMELWQNLEPRAETVRSDLATFFGVSANEIAITRNASESLQNVQMGMPLSKGDEVLTSDQDYPRMLTAWDQRSRREGITVKKVSFKVPVMDEDDVVQAFADAVTTRTKVMHISHVVFLTGQILPVRKLCNLARSKNIPCIVDGAHSFAHFPFMQSDLECDYFGTSLHKWLSGPIGTGMLYVAEPKIKDIWPLMAAAKESDGNIRKFEEIGTHPAALHNALSEAVAFANAIGLERKAKRLRYLHSLWTDRLKNYDNVWFGTNINKESQQCGIRLVNIAGVTPAKLSAHLMDKHKIFTVGITHDQFQGIRVTPNVYTTPEEIHRFGDVMEEVAKNGIAN